MGTPSSADKALTTLLRGNNKYNLPSDRPAYLPSISPLNQGQTLTPTNSYSPTKFGKQLTISQLNQQYNNLQTQLNSVVGNNPNSVAYRSQVQAQMNANTQATKQIGGQQASQSLTVLTSLGAYTGVAATNAIQVSSASKYQLQALNTLPQYLRNQAKLHNQSTSNVNANRVPTIYGMPVIAIQSPPTVASGAIRPKFNSPSTRGVVIVNNNPVSVPGVIPSSLPNQRQPTIVGGRNRPNFKLSINQGIIPTSNGSSKNYIPSNAMRAPNMSMMNGNASLLNAVLRCF